MNRITAATAITCVTIAALACGAPKVAAVGFVIAFLMTVWYD